jgi:hypothetical protein
MPPEQGLIINYWAKKETKNALRKTAISSASVAL